MTLRKWAVVVDTDVAATISIDDTNTQDPVQRFIAAYDSNPTIVPVPDGQAVVHGWSWDGERFNPPVV